MAHARDRGVADLVTCTGWVSAGQWQAWIERLTCAVQLRVRTNGESAASIRDAMASGLPVVTNMIGADEEFPPGSLVTVASDAGPAALADRISEVCHDVAVWQRLSRLGWEYSQTVTEASVATQLALAIRGTVMA